MLRALCVKVEVACILFTLQDIQHSFMQAYMALLPSEHLTAAL